MKILIVDDSKTARARLRDYLQNLGHEVIAEASDGLEAIEAYKTHRPDVMITDLEMPNLKGIDASQQIIETIDPQAKIILATSIIDKKEVITAKRIGIKGVINKPFTQEEFATLLLEIV